MESNKRCKYTNITNKQLARPIFIVTWAALVILASQNFTILKVVITSHVDVSEHISFDLERNHHRTAIVRPPIAEDAARSEKQEDPSSSLGASPKPKTAIFLNAFISAVNPGMSVQIVHEQLRQLTNATHHKDAVLYYNIIGHNYSNLCPLDVNCQKLAYYESANEEVTLQALYDHCVDNEDDYVVYVHNKGSFHSSQMNDRKRRIATKGAFSEACTKIQQPSSPCNVCAFRFQTLPFSHIPANFWAANCQYVRSLVPPKSYEQSRRDLCKLIVQVYGPVEFCPTESIDNMEVSWKHGFGRMAMERWIPSHPSFVPCQVMPNTTLLRKFRFGWEPWIPTLEVAHRSKARMTEDQKHNMQLLMHEYSFLYDPELERTFCNTYFQKGGQCPSVEDKFKEVVANMTKRS
jgi:hypothetical protein